MRKPLLISAVTAAIIGAGVITYMNQEQPKPEENQAVQIQARDSSAVTHESTSDSPQPQDTQPVAVEPAPIVAEPVPTPSPAPVEQAELYVFAAEMAAAGFAEADYRYVNEMVLDAQGWRTFQRDKPVWHLARRTQGTLTEQLSQVKLYVQVNYGGDWAAAHSKYVTVGNF
ncbi:hypothetical protein HAV21_03380 [Paenarthrobacter sp. MSM-2-10-13]|uniref:hypothetical protein n=1 Tax=Paenarthrobacter sp. MSM-2-10-13 TaxID=2717318 RepID=UPI001420BE0D|nr:hypothetical protein [Paenarthrobacter sp. MSM-2-10-13]NHW45939.1 hypothetical protein [Paenarthrobacter sp. MSM-2-10-13]